MHIQSLRFCAALLLGALSSAVAFAADEAKGTLVPAKDANAEWLAKAQAAYPTDKCVVSEDKLGGDMGPPADFVYKEEGKPDRLVRFCCKDCQKDFKKEPAKYLSELDKAAAAKGTPAKDAGHAQHAH